MDNDWPHYLLRLSWPHYIALLFACGCVVMIVVSLLIDLLVSQSLALLAKFLCGAIVGGIVWHLLEWKEENQA